MQRIYRLSDRKVFKSIVKKKKIYSKKFLIHYQENRANVLRMAISVSKNNFKFAVTRNYIKRQIRTFFDQLPNKNVPIDILVVVNKSYLQNEYDNNCKEFKTLVNKIIHKQSATPS